MKASRARSALGAAARRLGLVQLWHRWMRLAGYIGDFQSRAFLTAFYFTVAAPFALLTGLVDPLRVRRVATRSGWGRWQGGKQDLGESRRQF